MSCSLGNAGQGAVTSDVIEKVRAKLLADDGAPATDVVTVVGARIVPYAVSVTVHVALGRDPASVRANAIAALQAHVVERHKIKSPSRRPACGAPRMCPMPSGWKPSLPSPTSS